MTIKIFKLSCQEIEKQFGQGNFDDATEYVWNLIYHNFDNNDKFIIRNIDFDDSHINPYFHTLNIDVEGIDSVTADLILQELNAKRLNF